MDSEGNSCKIGVTSWSNSGRLSASCPIRAHPMRVTICWTSCSLHWLRFSAVQRTAATWRRLAGRSKRCCGNFCRLEHGVPSHDTFSRVFRILDPEAFERAFRRFYGSLCGGQWAQPHRRCCGGRQSLAGGLRTGPQCQPDPHGQCLGGGSAHGAGLAQGTRPQRSCRGMGSAGDAVARGLHRYGRCPALQSSFCKAGARARRATTSWLSSRTRASCSQPWCSALPVPASAAAPNGWNDRPTIAANGGAPQSFATAQLADQQKFPGIVALARITSRRRLHGTRSVPPATRYFLLSTYLSAKALLRTVRSHWRIENQLHWVLDVVLAEDAQPKQERQRPREPCAPAQARSQHPSVSSRSLFHTPEKQARRMGRNLPAKPHQSNAIALPCGGGRRAEFKRRESVRGSSRKRPLTHSRLLYCQRRPLPQGPGERARDATAEFFCRSEARPSARSCLRCPASAARCCRGA